MLTTVGIGTWKILGKINHYTKKKRKKKKIRERLSSRIVGEGQQGEGTTREWDNKRKKQQGKEATMVRDNKGKKQQGKEETKGRENKGKKETREETTKVRDKKNVEVGKQYIIYYETFILFYEIHKSYQ